MQQNILNKSSHFCTSLSVQQPTLKQPVTAVTFTSEYPVLKDLIQLLLGAKVHGNETT